MPITIQELLASDTISQAVDKINFNFDQLILNGGGPAGPIGAAGPTGPIGGRGIRGEKWYEDPNATATDPNTLTFTDLIEGDNYLDADQDSSIQLICQTFPNVKMVLKIAILLSSHLRISSTGHLADEVWDQNLSLRVNTVLRL